ncbi:hypothetical protein GGD55_000307 [Rhizobium giardinii]|uniref:Uncharacterized protein n=1 Tax=Rhizobium giardinii TaxID=56731 RepID=A0A7W8X6G6_9HYPH|nr:hypothetical protein [Rhizobium giardinii]
MPQTVPLSLRRNVKFAVPVAVRSYRTPDAIGTCLGSIVW